VPGQDPDEAAAAHVEGVNAAVTGADDGATIVSCDANGLNLLRAITIANESRAHLHVKANDEGCVCAECNLSACVCYNL
jgi:hypothetical protein